MKKFAYLALLCVLATACRSNQYSDVVKETYIHKYGVPVAKSDWDAQGKDGKIIQLKKDGVTVTQSFIKGELHGETSYTFPNSSTIQSIEIYDQGILKGRKDSFASGVPSKEEIFENGELVKLTRWYEDGTPAVTEIYAYGTLISGEYRTPLNIVESRVQDGHGTRICRTNEGDLLNKDIIQGGSLIERVTYFSNGDPHTVTPYENGMVHGTKLTFLQGGLPDTVEQWVHGQQEGMTVVYVNGEKVSEITYAHGKKNGIEYRYRDGKFLVEELTWKNNKQHGLRKLYIDGETKSEWYHLGELVTRTTYERMNIPR